MSTHEPNPDPEAHYEKTQLGPRPFIIGGISFFIVMGVIYVVVGGLLQHWSRQPWKQWESPAPPMAEGRWNAGAPQLQIDPAIDLAKVRAMEDARLHALRWNDGTHAYATIPIDEAMKLMSDAAAKGQLNTVLTPPVPATAIQLQDQKSGEAGPPQVPNP